MTIGKKPSWWDEAKPYFIYDTDELEISKDAPQELQEKFKESQKKIKENNNI